MAIDIGTLSAKITADASQYRRALGRARNLTARFSRSVGRVTRNVGLLGAATSAAAFGGIAVMARRQAEVIAQTDKLANRLDVTTERMSALRFAARRSGISFDTLNEGIQELQLRLADARRGTTTMVEGLEAINVSLEELEGLNAAEKFERIGRAISQLPSAGERQFAADALFGGEAGRRLLTLFNTGLGRAVQKARELNLTFDRFDASRVRNANRAIRTMQAVINATVRDISIELSGSIRRLAQRITNFVDRNRAGIAEFFGSILRGATTLARKIIDLLPNIGQRADGILGQIGRAVGRFLATLPERVRLIFSQIRFLANDLLADITSTLASTQLISEDVPQEFRRQAQAAIDRRQRTLLPELRNAQNDFDERISRERDRRLFEAANRARANAANIQEQAGGSPTIQQQQRIVDALTRQLDAQRQRLGFTPSMVQERLNEAQQRLQEMRSTAEQFESFFTRAAQTARDKIGQLPNVMDTLNSGAQQFSQWWGESAQKARETANQTQRLLETGVFRSAEAAGIRPAASLSSNGSQQQLARRQDQQTAVLLDIERNTRRGQQSVVG